MTQRSSDHPLIAARAEILSSVDRWRHEIAAGASGAPNSAWFGVGGRSVTLCELLMSRAIDAVVPVAEVLPGRTLGERWQLLDRHGRKVRMSCLGLPRNLITNADRDVVNRLLKARNVIAHHAGGDITDPRDAGHLGPSDVLAFVDLADAFARLPIFDELECRIRGDQPTAEARVDGRSEPTRDEVATLYVNGDSSRCGACNRDADPRELRHVNEHFAIPPGCGARFVSVSSDLEMSERIRASIIELRPDLPMLGERAH